MKLKTKSKRDYEDDGLLPLVNIIFLLLIFFMIVGIIEKNILKDNIELPKVALDKFENKDVAKIFYDTNKNIYLNDVPINIKDLRETIKANEVKDVVLIADKSLLVKDINIVLYELKQNQINNIKLLSSLNAN
jgi:biopolymer transport protein ExbD|tara:strand:- start:1285 stop:1683 length:399 start_codon:yes stop_codon:yes gene_type:complete